MKQPQILNQPRKYIFLYYNVLVQGECSLKLFYLGLSSEFWQGRRRSVVKAKNFAGIFPCLLLESSSSSATILSERDQQANKTCLMEQLLSSQLTGLRIKSGHRQLLCGRMGYGLQ